MQQIAKICIDSQEKFRLQFAYTINTQKLFNLYTTAQQKCRLTITTVVVMGVDLHQKVGGDQIEKLLVRRN